MLCHTDVSISDLLTVSSTSLVTEEPSILNLLSCGVLSLNTLNTPIKMIKVLLILSHDICLQVILLLCIRFM